MSIERAKDDPASIVEVLLCVRGLIDQPEKFCKGMLAQNAEGRKVALTHPHACRFSLDGAFLRYGHVTHKFVGPAYNHLKRTVWPFSEGFVLSHFSDARGTTHFTVLAMLDKAITTMGGSPPQESDGD